MKIIIISTALIFAGTFTFAQQNKIVKQNPISTEDPHNPLVNGILYNQYKVQVQAENKRRAAERSKAEADQKKELEKMNSVKI